MRHDEVPVQETFKHLRKQPVNVISLAGLLEGASSSFRAAVLEALAAEGFELDEPVPNLQQAREILDAIDWLESRGHGHHWKRFEALLHDADQECMLVDLGVAPLLL